MILGNCEICVEVFHLQAVGIMRDFAGCYIGQETVARLITYKGVKQHLWGLNLDGHVDPGTSILLDGEKVCIYLP